MSYAYTSDVLVAQIKLRGMIPSSDNTLTTANYLTFINDEMQSTIVPLLMSTREEFYAANVDTSISASTSTYAIPERAIGAKLRDVQILSGSEYVPLTRLEPHTLPYGASSSTGTPEGYYLEGNNVILYPTPAASGTLRLRIFRRPNRVVTTAEVATVTGVSGVTVTISSSPSAFPTTSTSYDFIESTGPAFTWLAVDQSATRSSTTLTFSSSAAATGLAVGDFVALAGETSVPQLPIDLHPLLAERCVVRALEALGDPKAAVHEKTADRLMKSAMTMLTPRVEGGSRYVVPREYSRRRWFR